MPNNEQQETTYPIYNQYIYKEGIGWVLIGGGDGGGDSLPDQTNNSGKYLTTNGSEASWSAVTPASIGALPTGTTAAQIGAIPDTHVVNGITQADIDDWNSDETFIAEFNTTSYTDTLNAYNDGKIIIGHDVNTGRYVPLSYYDSTNEIFQFLWLDSDSRFHWKPLRTTGWSADSQGQRYVQETRTINNQPLSANVVLNSSDVGAIPDTHVANGITAQDIANWNDSDVFIATYGTTTYADTLAAYNAGKLVVAKDGANYVPLSEYDTTNNRLRFYYWDLDKPYWWNLTSSGWGNGTGTAYVSQNRTINSKDLSSNITLTATDVGAIPDSAAAAGITSEDITNWNNKPSVDELVKQVPLNGNTSFKSLLFAPSQGNTTNTETVYKSDYISYCDSTQELRIKDANSNKYSLLAYNRIGLANNSNSYRGIINSTNFTNNRTYSLPDNSGTLALTDDIPTSLNDLTNDPGFITTPNIPYLTCETAADTAAKTTTLVSGSFGSTDLVAGAQVLVKFTNANGIANPTISINGTTAKSIKRYGTTAPGTSAASSWNAGAVVMLVYDGTYWQMEAFMNNTYSGMSDNEVTAGTGTSNRLITPARLKTAIQTWAMPYNHDASGITSTDIANWDAKVSDDHKWNDVALMHNLYANSTSYILPFLSSQNATQADLVTATATPTAKTVAVYDANAYLNSTTPTVHDTSTKVATTDFVATELSYIDGLPTQTNNAGKFLTTNGTTASWTSIDTLLDYKGVKSTTAQLPSSDNVTGDVWLVSEDNSEYIWNGTTWEKFGPTIDLSGYVPTSRKVNNKALSSDITLSASDVGAIPDSAAAAGIEAADITAWNAKPSVDELVKQTPLNGANRGKGLLFSNSTGATETTNTAYTSDKIVWNDSSATLYIYNSARNKSGWLKYDRILLANGTNSYTGAIQANTTLTADTTYTLPASTGTLALVSQIPTSLNGLTNDPGFITDSDLSTILADYMVKGVDYVTAGRKINTIAGNKSTAEGSSNTASGDYSHAEGVGVTASGRQSHAEGSTTHATEQSTHAEGAMTKAAGTAAHSEGSCTLALGQGSHSEGVYTGGNATAIHSEGYGVSYEIQVTAGAETNKYNITTENVYIPNGIAYSDLYIYDGVYGKKWFNITGLTLSGRNLISVVLNEALSSQVISNSTKLRLVIAGATRAYSHIEGLGTICINASGGEAQHVGGKYNVAIAGAEVIGGGTDNANRANIRTLDWSGNEVLAGKLTLGAGPTNNMDAATKEYVDTKATITIVDWTAA